VAACPTLQEHLLWRSIMVFICAGSLLHAVQSHRVLLVVHAAFGI